MTNSAVATMCNDRPCHAGSANQEITVNTDPMIGDISPPKRPNMDPIIFQGEAVAGRLYVVAIKQIEITLAGIKKV